MLYSIGAAGKYASSNGGQSEIQAGTFAITTMLAGGGLVGLSSYGTGSSGGPGGSASGGNRYRHRRQQRSPRRSRRRIRRLRHCRSQRGRIERRQGGIWMSYRKRWGSRSSRVQILMTVPFLQVPLFTWPATPGGKLHTYAAGGTTPQTTWSDAAGTVPNSNPVTLDTTGSATVRGNGAYHFVLKDATDTTTLWDADNYSILFNTVDSSQIPMTKPPPKSRPG